MVLPSSSESNPRVAWAIYWAALVIALLGLSCIASSAYAGEISFATDKSNRVFVTFTGSIKPGDTAKLRDKIQKSHYLYLWSQGLVVNSDGGDVLEAVKLGKLVAESGWRVDVQENGVCASACFLIYVAAPIRYSGGRIIIHRPYFLMDYATGADAYKIGNGYRETISAVRSYLSEYMVPTYLIDIMMSKDSSQGYTLTPQDVVNVGFFSPAIDEYQVQKCNFPTDHRATKGELDNVEKCREQYFLQARIKFLYGDKYAEASKAVADLEAYLKVLPLKFAPNSIEYKESLLEVERVVNNFPPRRWMTRLTGSTNHQVKE